MPSLEQSSFRDEVELLSYSGLTLELDWLWMMIILTYSGYTPQNDPVLSLSARVCLWHNPHLCLRRNTFRNKHSRW